MSQSKEVDNKLIEEFTRASKEARGEKSMLREIILLDFVFINLEIYLGKSVQEVGDKNLIYKSFV